MPHDRPAAVVEQVLKEEVCRPFDLSRAPLWRALWIARAEEAGVLALTFHHSVIDEWSLRVLFRELEALYAGAGAGGRVGGRVAAVERALCGLRGLGSDGVSPEHCWNVTWPTGRSSLRACRSTATCRQPAGSRRHDAAGAGLSTVSG
ncbi:MAG: condensation domain-containing protein [Verrucomicrobia bacterium]|nr:condensation domain-containing protein [Verrucomicrobiota bacterium]